MKPQKRERYIKKSIDSNNVAWYNNLIKTYYFL
jgi:hypothetical protein